MIPGSKHEIARQVRPLKHLRAYPFAPPTFVFLFLEIKGRNYITGIKRTRKLSKKY